MLHGWVSGSFPLHHGYLLTFSAFRTPHYVWDMKQQLEWLFPEGQDSVMLLRASLDPSTLPLPQYIHVPRSYKACSLSTWLVSLVILKGLNCGFSLTGGQASNLILCLLRIHVKIKSWGWVEPTQSTKHRSLYSVPAVKNVSFPAWALLPSLSTCYLTQHLHLVVRFPPPCLNSISTCLNKPENTHCASSKLVLPFMPFLLPGSVPDSPSIRIRKWSSESYVFT